MRFDVSRFSSLAEAKDHAKSEIDAAAERARMKVITPGAGQAMEYEQALRAAHALLAGQIASSPFLQADVDAGLLHPVTQQPVQDQTEAAQLVVFTAGLWETAGAEIRRARLAAKNQVDAAETSAQALAVMRAAVAQFDSFDPEELSP